MRHDMHLCFPASGTVLNSFSIAACMSGSCQRYRGCIDLRTMWQCGASLALSMLSSCFIMFHHVSSAAPISPDSENTPWGSEHLSGVNSVAQTFQAIQETPGSVPAKPMLPSARIQALLACHKRLKGWIVISTRKTSISLSLHFLGIPKLLQVGRKIQELSQACWTSTACCAAGATSWGQAKESGRTTRVWHQTFGLCRVCRFFVASESLWFSAVSPCWLFVSLPQAGSTYPTGSRWCTKMIEKGVRFSLRNWDHTLYHPSHSLMRFRIWKACQRCHGKHKIQQPGIQMCGWLLKHVSISNAPKWDVQTCIQLVLVKRL